MQPREPNFAKGIDVSHYQGEIDWQQVKDAGISFAYLKATEGYTITDSMFERNVAGARAAGILIGPYHFFHATKPSEAKMEARSFIDAVAVLGGGFNNSDLPPMLDLEAKELSDDGSLPALCRVWLEVVEEAAGKKPLIYTYPSFANERLDASLAEDGYPLWIAQYTEAEQPSDVPGWSDWTIWQHSRNGKVPGIDGDVDMDVFFGTREELERMAESKKTNFSDVEAGRWSEAAIAAVADAGLMTGFEDGTFRPTEPVTREQLAMVCNDLLYLINSKASGQPEK